MEYAPPPLFKQGPSARVRLFFFVVLSVIALIADVRFKASDWVRAGLSVVLYPIQAVVSAPLQAIYGAGGYVTSLAKMQSENEQLKRQHLVDTQTLHQLKAIQGENAQLRKLMGAAEVSSAKSVLAEIQYDARDPYSRKIIVNKGRLAGVLPGQPVIDDNGVVGQVTRSFPLQAEITLVTDKYMTVPVQVLRNGLRSVAYGGQEGGLLELRFMAANADVQADDVLVTSGIDGLYPAGVPVAKVIKVERNSTYAFARILCVPLAGVDRYRYVLILEVDNPLPPPPEPAPDEKAKGKRVRKDSGG
jgi:rod shape-determining protein MreC